jgi:hypothetical protein
MTNTAKTLQKLVSGDYMDFCQKIVLTTKIALCEYYYYVTATHSVTLWYLYGSYLLQPLFHPNKSQSVPQRYRVQQHP